MKNDILSEIAIISTLALDQIASNYFNVGMDQHGWYYLFLSEEARLRGYK